MKLFLPQITWEGGFGNYFKTSLTRNGVDVHYSEFKLQQSAWIGRMKLRHFLPVMLRERKYYLGKLNSNVLRECVSIKPDVFFIFNESNLSPQTIQSIREKCKCLMVCFIGDNPWDSTRWVADFPHSLKYFDIIFTGDPVWNNNIRKVAPMAKIFWNFGGYDDRLFTPLQESEPSDSDYAKYSCDLAFTGSSYGMKAEGAYRADVLSYLSDFDLRIWGGDHWDYRFQFDPQLGKCFKGEKLPFPDLRKLYNLAKIFINLPAPQICWGFQPRVFEIAGCEGFQIADNRLLLRYLFDEDELVVFDSMGDLRDKVNYYLDHDSERKIISEKLYNRVKCNYTWNHWAKRLLKTIISGEGILDLDLLLQDGKHDLSDTLRRL